MPVLGIAFLCKIQVVAAVKKIVRVVAERDRRTNIFEGGKHQADYMWREGFEVSLVVGTKDGMPCIGNVGVVLFDVAIMLASFFSNFLVCHFDCP